MTDNLHEYQYIFLIITRSVFLKMRNVSNKIVEKFKTIHFMFKTFFFLNRAFHEYVEKYCRTGQAIDDNMVHADYMLNN